jgi:hypothetical protein
VQDLAEKMIEKVFGGKIVRRRVENFDVVRPVEIFEKTEQFFFRTMRSDQTAHLEQVKNRGEIFLVLDTVEEQAVLFVPRIGRIKIVHDEDVAVNQYHRRISSNS